MGPYISVDETCVVAFTHTVRWCNNVFFFSLSLRVQTKIMSLNRKIVRKLSQVEKRHEASLVQSQFDSKKTYSTNSRRLSRNISDPGFYRNANPFGNSQNSSRFPMLVVENAPKKKMNGVVSLNKQCERKYRSWSDPCGERQCTENKEKVSHVGTFYKDDEDSFLPRLGKARKTETDSWEEKSFCDSLSSYPCSSIPSRSHSVLTDGEEDFFVLKHETVFSWVYGSRYGRKTGNRLPSSM